MSMSDTDHLAQAKRDIAAGDASSQRATDFYQRAADHIASALSGSTTQAQAAVAVGKSQPWISRLMKWRRDGFSAFSPFDDNAKARISRTNKSKKPEPKPATTGEQARAERARAHAEQAKAEAVKAKADAQKAKADAQRAKAERAKAQADAARAEFEALGDMFGGRKRAGIGDADRDTLVKVLGMLGSDQDGEVLNAARTAERLRRKLVRVGMI
jgi:uncharacterized membrane protein YqiK